MTEYQVFARKYRPQTFNEVIGQDPIVTTLKNGIRYNRLAQAYLFCGSHGTGKTTLARVFAKALNCQNPADELEPCNACASCKEITRGSSMNVLEVDGASNRGIDEIRQINETVGYASSSGKYKIYIIDEVHMLTIQAFNALLKTLEEPPPNVKFFFATTEPHKVPPTILSRCQRYNLNRIPLDLIKVKLKEIAEESDVRIDEQALHLIAAMADGGLRDAESLLDQIFALHEGEVTGESVGRVLGVISAELLFELDAAGKEGNLAKAFEISHHVFTEGKDIGHFIEVLTEHFRNLLIVKLAGKSAPTLTIPDEQRAQYETSAALYRKEQCISILEELVAWQQKIRFVPSPRIALEAILLKIIRSHQKIPVEFLVKRLADLEKSMGGSPPPQPLKREPAPSPSKPQAEAAPVPKPAPSPKPKPKETPPPAQNKQSAPITPEKQRHFDTVMQFAAVELEGNLQKHR